MTLDDPRNNILYRVDAGLARITLNRPQSLGAIDRDSALLWLEIARDLRDRDDVGAVILDSNGPAFCAGGDVLSFARLGEGAAAAVGELADVIHEGHRIYASIPVPIVTAVQGAVAGGGLGFMLVGDYVVAASRAVFVSKYADIGLTPDCGVSTLLPEAVGMRRALELTLTDRVLDADTALAWGLVNEVVAPEELASRAEAVAAHWMNGATAAFGQAKRLLRAGIARPYAEGLDDEARTIAAAVASEAARTRIAAFAARSNKGEK